jgi:hypothetical protein
MNSRASGGTSSVEERNDSPREVSGVVDWLVGGGLVLVGLAVALVGGAVYLLTDRALLADLVADGTIESGSLSPAELVDFSVPFAGWLGIGLGLTGLVLAVGGVAFVASRRRTRRTAAAEGRTAGTFGANAVYGAAATVVLSFVPASAALGGALAAYLQNDRERSGAKIGAVSGLVASVPVVLLVTFVFVGVVAGLAAIGESALGLVLVGVGLFALAVVALFNAGLGAVGGIVGERFVGRDGRR